MSLPWLRRPLRLLLFGPLLGLGLGLAFALLAWRAAHGRFHPRTGEAAGWWYRLALRLFGVSVRVAGGAPRAGALVAANHISWLDILVLGGVAPVAFVSKADVKRWPLVGWMVTAGATLYLPRGENQASGLAGEIARRLAAGWSVAIFPEGTTTDGSRVRAFFPRLFAGALEAGAAIQPVAISYPWSRPEPATAPFVGEESLPSHLWRLLASPPIAAELRFLEPLETGAAVDRRAAAAAARLAICEALSLPTEVLDRRTEGRAFVAASSGKAMV